jgi:hypothetical protein
LTVSYSVSGTASSGIDFTALSGSVTFQAGEAFALVEVEALSDATADPGETVVVTSQSGTGYTVDSGANSATLTIMEDAPVVWIDSSSASVAEGDSGEVVIKRSGGDLTKALTVAVYIGAGSGTPPLWVYDYTVDGRDSNWSGWGQVTFAPNQDTVTLTIQAREDDEAEGDEEFVVELGADDTSYLLGTATSVAVTITNVVPSGTVPILADSDKPLTVSEVIILKSVLDRLAKGKDLSPAQQADLERYLTRLGNKGIDAEGEQRLQQLSSLLDRLGDVINKPAVVGQALSLYSAAVEEILGGVKVAKENEYKTFKQQMGDVTGAKAQERFNEIKAGYRADWVDYYFLRYRAEQLKGKLNSMQNP